VQGSVKDRNFRLLFVGQTLSTLGSMALLLALPVWAKDLTGSTAAAGAVFFFLVAPSLLGPLAGLLVDRLARRRLMIGVDIIAGSAVLALLIVDTSGQLWVVYGVALVYGSCYVTFQSARSALLATTVASSQLIHANGALRAMREGVRLAGPLFGAGLYAVWGGQVLAVIDAVTFFTSAACLLMMQIQEPTDDGGPTEPAMKMVRQGLSFLRGSAVLRFTVAVLGCSVLGFGLFEVSSIAIVADGLGQPPSFLGVLVSVQGAAGVAGGVSAAALVRRWDVRVVLVSALAAQTCGFALATTGRLSIVVAGFAAIGFGTSCMMVITDTLLQTCTPANMQGRVYAAYESLTAAPYTVSLGVGAGLVDIVDYRVLIALAAATHLTLAVTVAIQSDTFERAATTAAFAPHRLEVKQQTYATGDG